MSMSKSNNYNMNEDDDVFDDSFLMDFDPDVIVKQQQQQQQANQSGTFGSNSKFSMGTIDSTQYMSLPSSIPSKRMPLSNIDNDLSSSSLSKKVKYTSDITTPTTTSPTQMISNTLTHEINPQTISQYNQTLSKYFGYNSFRSGQLQIIHSIIEYKKDTSVFWSTGSGKSICYQIPPLHTKKIAIIVSPLISLMEDQVSKLNGLLLDGDSSDNHDKKQIAVYLGSGQTDLNADYKALQGEYSFIYCTPEKLLSQNGSFLNSLATLHEKTSVGTNNGMVNSHGSNICLIAVDESHCVSEWGHDFRPEYRQLGKQIRTHPIISKIPIVALTATAIPRVQSDIISSLRLRNPTISQQSFDRPNLIISIKRKPASGAYRTALQPLVQELKSKYTKKSITNNDSTIIYCRTQKFVEEVSEWLSYTLASNDIKVQPYHGGMSTEQRTDAHINFLTGKTMIIVATIAFGMGIDKPDTRRIIHYGPPKTVEEYYQQIGRAGRDGLESYCTMFADAGDFESYKDDFYLGRLSDEAKMFQTQSIDALRQFALSEEVCRRAELLRFFGEKPIFGERCGTCDTCKMRQLHSDDVERDFATDGARVVLYALSTLNGKQGSSVLEKVLKGNTVDNWRYRRNISNTSRIAIKIGQLKNEMKAMKKKAPVSYFIKDLLPSLVDRGYVEMNSQSSTNTIYGTRKVSNSLKCYCLLFF